MNYSWQRQVVQDTVLNQRQHLTAQQVLEIARQTIPRLSLGTVYRNLNTLVEMKKLGRVSIAGEADRYDWDPTPHPHFFCRKCKKVLNSKQPRPHTDPILALMPECEGYCLIVTGLCKTCAKKAKAKKAAAERKQQRALAQSGV